MGIEKYYKKLKSHDWYHTMSDDASVYRKGCTSYNELKHLSGTSDEHLRLFEGFNNHYFSGPAWGTEKQPLPELMPEEVQGNRIEEDDFNG